jgi:hypothetical protein
MSVLELLEGEEKNVFIFSNFRSRVEEKKSHREAPRVFCALLSTWYKWQLSSGRDFCFFFKPVFHASI